MNNLYILGEEQPTDIQNTINAILTEEGVDFSFTNIKSGMPVLTLTNCSANGKFGFVIDGITSNSFNKVFYYITKQPNGRGSFVDFLFFLEESLPTEKSIPLAAVEHTKNSANESGNMSDQRSSKPIALRSFYGNSVPYYYIVEAREHVTPSQVHKNAFSRINFLGGKVLFCTEDRLSYMEISVPAIASVSDIIKQESLKRKPPRGSIPNQVIVNGGDIILSSNLLKSGGSHDPNEGYVASSVQILSSLSPSSRIILKNHRQDKKFFSRKGNKFLNALHGHNVYVEYSNGSIEKIDANKSKRQKYWEYCSTGEKLSTILLEIALKNQGWITIFTNHAGCGKSNILSMVDGSKTRLAKSSLYGQKGIPDLVMYNPSTSECLVIEGERSVNYQGGVKQVKDMAFLDCFQQQMLSKVPVGTSCKSYVCTYGDQVQQEHNFYSLDTNGKEHFETNIKPIWEVKR